MSVCHILENINKDIIGATWQKMEFPPRCAFLMTNKLDQEHIYQKTVELCDVHVHFWIKL